MILDYFNYYLFKRVSKRVNNVNKIKIKTAAKLFEKKKNLIWARKSKVTFPQKI